MSGDSVRGCERDPQSSLLCHHSFPPFLPLSSPRSLHLSSQPFICTSQSSVVLSYHHSLYSSSPLSPSQCNTTILTSLSPVFLPPFLTSLSMNTHNQLSLLICAGLSHYPMRVQGSSDSVRVKCCERAFITETPTTGSCTTHTFRGDLAQDVVK